MSRALGFDDRGLEVLSYLPGEVVGASRPWPGWVHSDDALCQVACWLRDLHVAVAGFEPPAGAVWREGGAWRPGLIVGHNDAAPYNAVWADGRLTGFFDWDLAAAVTPEWDLAFTAFAWVPLHARHVVAAEGFTASADRPRRLRLFLDAYGTTPTRRWSAEASTRRWRQRWANSPTSSPNPTTDRSRVDRVLRGFVLTAGECREPVAPSERWLNRARHGSGV
ncbi:MAG TPA: phosphotransferase [Mycobacteriales bacterium]